MPERENESVFDILREMHEYEGEDMIDDSEGPYSPIVRAVPILHFKEYVRRLENILRNPDDAET